MLEDGTKNVNYLQSIFGVFSTLYQDSSYKHIEIFISFALRLNKELGQ